MRLSPRHVGSATRSHRAIAPASASRLRLDLVDLPSTDLVELSGKTFHFPKNPEDRFIDASVYIYHSHHPADVTRITFGSISLAGIAVEMDVDLCFDVEGLGEFKNAHWVVSTALRHGEKKRLR